MADERAPSLDGRVLANTYRVEGLLAEGGMGAVYRARHLRTGGEVAVKLLSQAAQAHPDVLRRFQDEARIASGLRHPSIVQVTDFDEDEDGTPFMVMELLDGEDLFHRLKRVGRLPLEETLELALQIGGALQAAHERGVIHRDVKPQNLFFTRHSVADETFEVLKIVDFGLSKVRRPPSQQTWDHLAPGTPYYMAPEIARGRGEPVDGRADQFSLAVVLYRCLSGTPPFDAEGDLRALIDKVLHAEPAPLGLLVPGLPAGVAGAISRALSKRADDRYPSMAAFVRAITGQAQITGRRAAYAPPSGPVSRLRSSWSETGTTLPGANGQFVQPERPRLRRRAALGVGAVVGVVCAALLWSSRPLPPAHVAEPLAPLVPAAAAAAPPPLVPELEPAPAPLQIGPDEPPAPAPAPRHRKKRLASGKRKHGKRVRAVKDPTGARPGAR